MKVDNLKNNILQIPAINQQVGNSNGAGSLDLGDSSYPILSGYLFEVSDDDLNISKLQVASHRNSSFTLQNLQCGGVSLSASSNPILQNLNISLDFNRTNLYGLGSNYVFDRKLEFPINGTIDLQALVSGVSSGFISGMLNNESGYDFDIAFSDPKNIINSGAYKFQNAKLENFNYSTDINDIMNFTASFSIEILNNSGFSISRRAERITRWDSVETLWNSTNITWQ
jgi:hypothetical protein